MKYWLRLALVTGFYALLFVLFTWPLATQLTTAFPTRPGSGGDSLLYIWNFWNFREAVASGNNPFYTNWLLYPGGTSLWMHAYMPVLGMLNVWLQNEMLIINLGLLVSHTLIKQLRNLGVPDYGGPWWGGDAVSYLLPAPNSRFLDFGWAQRLFLNPKVYNIPGSVEIVLFLGYSLLLLGLIVMMWPNRPASRRHLDAAGRWPGCCFFCAVNAARTAHLRQTAS
ncbi:hypothetical protein [Hymenobacter sp. DG25A]|uniref:hypothetical protein n=1 Tax=Hymenobacter sp. DG25A TaxID=1385663 RepID=UPI0006BD566B|nr:hypothetical protein [Hymenobacter sp. DG25A]ALD22048.1 hypothetical protein AM218_13530 [Hymenobacter sp. DG25A]